MLISCEIKLILFMLALSTSWVKLVTILFSIRVLIRKLFLNLKDALIFVNHVYNVLVSFQTCYIHLNDNLKVYKLWSTYCTLNG